MAFPTRMSTSAAIAVCALLAHVQPTDGAAFRGRMADLAATQGASPELERALLAEIEDLLGSEHRKATEKRLKRIEAALRATFAALPKNEQGRLDHSAVRYAMHRLFVQRHGWFIQGLDSSTEAWNSSNSTAILPDRLPSLVQLLFERRVGGRGLDLHELAVMAATLENLIHGEALDRLEHTYRSLERSKKDPLSLEESHEVVDAYMAIYILGFNYSAMSTKKIREQRENILEIYPSWPETQKFVREVQTSAAPTREELTYENVVGIIEEVGERYGRWQDGECRSLKQDLLKMEDRGTGRVRLADFYRDAVHGSNWMFNENVQYLRELGALDESDPQNPRVLIANYVNSPANCVASSSYYSVCCIDECEDILGHMEEKLGAAEATPDEITALISALASSTVVGNRILPASLLHKLDEVAEHHGGRIPLHGRLFAQWLHQAYPRECAYPHITGSIDPLTLEAWMVKNGRDSSASRDEMLPYVTADAAKGSLGSVTPDEEYSMWTMHEEIKIKSRGAAIRKATGFGTLRGAFAATAVVALALLFAQSMSSALAKRSEVLLPKYCSSKYV